MHATGKEKMSGPDWDSNPAPSAHCVDILPIELMGPLMIYQSNSLHIYQGWIKGFKIGFILEMY